MAIGTYEVVWGPDETERSSFELNDEFQVGALISQICQELRPALQIVDEDGQETQYVLYTRRDDKERKLFERRPLQFYALELGDRLYLTQRRKLWWKAAESDRTTVFPRPPIQLSVSPPQQQCLVTLAPGCIIVPDRYLMINRHYLLQNLPHQLVEQERRWFRQRHHSKLKSVSKTEHCVLELRNRHWVLTAVKPLFVDDQLYEIGRELVLNGDIAVTLGRHGWPIAISVR